MLLPDVVPDWADAPCIVAASGPSLTPEVINRVRMIRMFEKWRVIAVNDTCRAMPFADILYACDPHWWDFHNGCPSFPGEKWAPHSEEKHVECLNTEAHEKWGVHLVRGTNGNTFSLDCVHFGHNSGFQAINLAILKGCTQVVLVGFDMRNVNGASHFFGDHVEMVNGKRTHMSNTPDRYYEMRVAVFAEAAKRLPAHISIVNATPGSALKCFPMMELGEAVDHFKFKRPDGVPHSDRAEPHAATG